jgi:beta-phosphoglucomutase-like phosphatase (HAD superfamily)
MTLAALIFDVDGTLADTEEAHRQSFNAAFASHGLPWTWDATAYAGLLRVPGGKERLRHFIGGLDLSLQVRQRLLGMVGELHRTKTAAYADCMARGGVALNPWILSLLREARAEGVALAIASTTSPANIDALFQGAMGAAPTDWFSVIAAGDDVARKKPAPDVYRLALTRLGLDAADCVAFEDSALGVSAAKAAGLWTIACPNRWTAQDDLSGADLLLDDGAASRLSLADLRTRHRAAVVTARPLTFPSAASRNPAKPPC